jgi:hypothetical protein
MPKKEEDLVVYWAPTFKLPSPVNYNPKDPEWAHNINWNLSYKDPVNSLEELKSRRNKAINQDSYLYCPAVKDFHKNIYMFNNSVAADLFWDSYSGELVSRNAEYIGASVRRPPSLNKCLIVNYSLSYLFFCEEDLQMEVTSPFFHKTKYSQYGAFVAGAFNIGSWFREINTDIQLWEGVQELQIDKDDPLFYAKFNTTRNVILKRFTVNEELQAITAACRSYKYTFGPFAPLAERYKQFKDTKTNKIVAKIIKENLVPDE